MQTIGTVLGDTLFGECSGPAPGEAFTTVYLQTTNGGFDAGYDEVGSAVGATSGTSIAGSTNEPAGSITAPAVLLPAGAAGGSIINGQIELTQLAPVAGYMVVHAIANSNSSPPTCHVSVMSFPTATGTVTSSAQTSSSGRAVPRSPKHLVPGLP
jgi:hypothetical protein